MDGRTSRQQHEVERGFSRRVGARRTRVVRIGSWEMLPSLLRLPEGSLVLPTLGGMPVGVPDLRLLAPEARGRDRAVVADNTLASSFGAAPLRRGAHLAMELLDRVLGEGSGLAAVSLSRDSRRVAGLDDAVDALEGATAAELDALAAALPAFDLRRRAANDEAMVVACYLRCHPAVRGIRYPGLPDDPDHEVAAALLFDGFGPVVDYQVGGDGAWRRVACDGGDARALVARLESLLPHLEG